MIRIYGVTVGNGSYARVVRGVARALGELGLCDGVVPLDLLDDWDTDYGGQFAKVAVVIAPQTARAAVSAATMGMHEQRLMLLPMNSSYCPESMLKLSQPMPEQGRTVPLVTGWLTPSRWSAEQLLHLTPSPVTVWRHGVGAEFVPDDALLSLLRESRAQGEFRVLHLTSTPRQRKGTALLIEAWSKLLRSGALPKQSRLTLVLSSEGSGGAIDAKLALMPSDVAASVHVIRTPLDLSEQDASSMYQGFHAIAQPSRGEGFGMVPLEALCCGVPVVATACSGHSEFLADSTPGLSVVRHGPVAKMDDGPGALAPSVTADAVADALVRAHDGWDALADAARASAAELGKTWSWTSVMRQWAAKEGWLA